MHNFGQQRQVDGYLLLVVNFTGFWGLRLEDDGVSTNILYLNWGQVMGLQQPDRNEHHWEDVVPDWGKRAGALALELYVACLPPPPTLRCFLDDMS